MTVRGQMSSFKRLMKATSDCIEDEIIITYRARRSPSDAEPERKESTPIDQKKGLHQGLCQMDLVTKPNEHNWAPV